MAAGKGRARLGPKLDAGRQRLVRVLAACGEITPSSSISSCIQPAPAPTIKRPFESTSMVASILAVSMYCRCGTTITEVRNRSFDVTPARYAIVES